MRDFTICSNTNGLGLRLNTIKDLCPLILHQLVVGWIGKAHGSTSGIRAGTLATVSLLKCDPRPFKMDRSQSYNAPPYFDGSSYAFWEVRIRAFLCSIDDSVWDAIEIGWTRPPNPHGIRQLLRQLMLIARL